MTQSLAAESHPVIRAARAALIGLDGARVAVVTMVVDDVFPPVVMFKGEPFLFDLGHDPVAATDASIAYRQARAYRADAMVIEEVGA